MKIGVARREVLVSWIVTTGLCAVVSAQRPSDVIRWSAVGPDGPVRPGAIVVIRVTADIDPGWHLYAFNQPSGGPRSLEVNAAKGTPLTVVGAKIDAPPPKVQHDPNFNLDTRYYDEPTTISVPVRVVTTATPGVRRAALEILFQACTERLCLRPFTETVTVEITVAGGSGRVRER
jgi:hypothetical protein